MRKAGIVGILLALAAGGCSSSSSSATAPAATTQLNVFAAASLTAAFTKIGTDYEAANAGMKVTFNFGSSTDLAAQIESEGTADVFASASGTAMDTVEAKPGVTDRTNFATNELVIVTPPDNPGSVDDIKDLGTPGVKLVLAAEGVPVGDYARESLKNAGVYDVALKNVVSNEPDDSSVVAKVVSGDADAGIVYTSDVSAAAGNQLRSVAIPEDINVLATYPIAVVTGSTNATAARSFEDYVVGPAGQATLKTFGFGPPPTG